MTKNSKRSELFDYLEEVGSAYGVENFSIFLYSLVKMQKPELLLELGSGTGACSLLAATGMKENNKGSVISADNGQQWAEIKKLTSIAKYLPREPITHIDYLRSLSEYFEVAERINYIDSQFPDFPDPKVLIDIIFVDYESQPAAIVQVLKYYLPKMNDCFSIFIDGVSTYLPSFLYIEQLVNQINDGKIPVALYSSPTGKSLCWWMEFAATRRLKLMHLTESINRRQNSTIWIFCEPIDHRPYPKAQMF